MSPLGRPWQSQWTDRYWWKVFHFTWITIKRLSGKSCEQTVYICKIGPSSGASLKHFFWPLQVENPSCLWGRVIWGPGGDAETTEQYDGLLAQMNLFYHDVTQDLHKLKPTSLEEGQVMQHLQSFFTHIFTHMCVTPNWTEGGLDVCVTVFPLRCVWCTGQWWSRGVGLWWSRSLWTLCPVRLAASWLTTENDLSSP